MKELTFALDVQLNDNEDWIPAGTKVQVADTWKKYDGSTSVIITEAVTFKGKSITFRPFVEVFMNGSFVELA